MTKIITFLSDFGTKASYPAQMKAVASSITDAQLIDITHNITAHNIREAAFILKTSVIHFPAGTVHIAVVDPGVGTNRKGLVIVTRSQIFVGPDNGVLIPAARSLGDFNVYEITNQNLMLNPVSSTFHGRDIFTPIAANIVNGLPFEQIGPVITDFINLNFEPAIVTEKTATGKILYIDDFGNIITNITNFDVSRFLNHNKKIMVFIGNKNHEMPFVKTYNLVKQGQLLATIGSSNYLEISINQGNAAEKLKVKPDDEIKILYN
jgi:hypothetical protein